MDIYPRIVKDIDGDGKADIVGFGDEKVYISYSNGKDIDGIPQNYDSEIDSTENFCVNAGNWRTQEEFIRFIGYFYSNNTSAIMGLGADTIYKTAY